MKVLKSFVRKKKIYVRKKRIKYRRYAVKKNSYFIKKDRGKRKYEEAFQGQKKWSVEGQGHSKIGVQIISRLFQG